MHQLTYLWPLLISLALCGEGKFSDVIRPVFEAQFEEKCSKYQFVEDWYRMFERPHYDEHQTKFAISVFFENPRVRQGGLGDKLAGVVNVIAYAIRTGRILVSSL